MNFQMLSPLFEINESLIGLIIVYVCKNPKSSELC